jgi:hypothetical protein
MPTVKMSHDGTGFVLEGAPGYNESTAVEYDLPTGSRVQPFIVYGYRGGGVDIVQIGEYRDTTKVNGKVVERIRPQLELPPEMPILDPVG